MLLEFFKLRVTELRYTFYSLLGVILFFLFAADILYYILALFKLVSWNPKYNPFRPNSLHRRLQVLCVATAGSPLFITTLFVIWCLFNLSYVYWWFLPYTCYCLFDKTHLQGGRPSQWWRNCAIYRTCVPFFPAALVKWHKGVEFPPDKPYLFGYHPHGILSCGVVFCWGTEGANLSQILPGLNIAPCTLNVVFAVPFLRELALALGFIGVGRDSLDYVLRQGNGKGALVVVGGAQEAMQTKPGSHDLVLSKRKGFFRVALNHGCRLVPVFAFGENNLYGKVEPKMWQIRLSSITQEYFGFAIPPFRGRGVFQDRFGLLPIRHPLNIVIGDPIECPKIENPTDEQIHEIQKTYCDSLLTMFNEVKYQYANDPKTEKLEFVL